MFKLKIPLSTVKWETTGLLVLQVYFKLDFVIEIIYMRILGRYYLCLHYKFNYIINLRTDH